MQEEKLAQLLLEQGTYYKESLKWHCIKHYYVFIERTWLGLFTVILLSCLLITGINIYSLMPLKESFNVLHYAEDDIYDELVIPVNMFDLDTKKRDLQETVEQYLIHKYVTIWETTNSDTDEVANYVYYNSAFQLKEKFTNSRTRSLQRGKKTAKISDISFKKIATGTLKTAIVKLSVSDNEGTRDKRARINFKLNDVLMAQKNRIPLDFIVSGYEEI